MKSSASNRVRKILFIVNPNAGKKISDKIIEAIRLHFPANIYYQIVIWKDKNNFEEIIAVFKDRDYTDVVAVGGDGTVNAVANSLVNTNISLGIVPVGSGNGLARSIGLSMSLEKVIQQIVVGKKTAIDVGYVNNQAFFCTSGVGFDAQIGQLFATAKKRGLSSYIKITLQQLFSYRAKTYILKLNNQDIKRKAFLITVANAGQYGNDFYIAPQAKLNDNLFHVVVLKPFNALSVFGIFFKIISGKAHQSKSIETFATDRLQIIRENEGSIHFDGEPASEGITLNYQLNHRALQVIVGDKFKA
jgi:YegS/Rv2252/BmrU family lipid kinase